MPRFEITAPDGRRFEVNAPDGATSDEVMAYAQKNFGTAAAPASAPGGATGSWEPAPPSRTDRLLRGLRDPIDGGAQLLTNLLPAKVVDAGNRLNNWVADKTGLVGRLPDGGVNEQVQQQERDYQAARGKDAGFDGMRVLGNVLSPANLAIASRAPAAVSLAGRVATGAGAGAASAALNPVAGDDYWDEKGQQIAAGGAFGGLTPVATGMLGRLISPNASTNPNVAALRAEDVRPTIGQTLGGMANRVEEKLMSVPIMGDAIRAARESAQQDLNRAAFNRALAPIKDKLPKGTNGGREAVQYTENALGKAYDRLLPKLTVQADDQFAGQVATLRAMVNDGAIDPNYVTKFNRLLDNRVLDKFQGQKAMTGQTFKDVESTLSAEIRRYGAAPDPDSRLLSDALKELQAGLRGLQVRSNPSHAKELQDINKGWANFKRVQRAASSVGTEEGEFSAAQLQNAVKAMDRSKDKGRFAEGGALMQDLSDAGKSVLGSKVPNSGTADRMWLGAGGLGLGYFDPMIPAGLLLGAGLYSSPAQSLLRGAVTARPQSAQAVRDTLLKASPRLLPGGAQVGLGLLD